jgi:hypothetical protein
MPSPSNQNTQDVTSYTSTLETEFQLTDIKEIQYLCNDLVLGNVVVDTTIYTTTKPMPGKLRFWKIFQKLKLVGYTIAHEFKHETKNYIMIKYLCASDQQKATGVKGIGTFALKTVEAYARDNKMSAVFIDMPTPSSKGFYEKKGYKDGSLGVIVYPPNIMYKKITVASSGGKSRHKPSK